MEWIVQTQLLPTGRTQMFAETGIQFPWAPGLRIKLIIDGTSFPYEAPSKGSRRGGENPLAKWLVRHGKIQFAGVAYLTGVLPSCGRLAWMTYPTPGAYSEIRRVKECGLREWITDEHGVRVGVLADAGYVGLNRADVDGCFPEAQVQARRPRGGQLSAETLERNKRRGTERWVVEARNGRAKLNGLFKTTWRGVVWTALIIPFSVEFWTDRALATLPLTDANAREWRNAYIRLARALHIIGAAPEDLDRERDGDELQADGDDVDVIVDETLGQQDEGEVEGEMRARYEALKQAHAATEQTEKAFRRCSKRLNQADERIAAAAAEPGGSGRG
jgi:hypothetical protein